MTPYLLLRKTTEQFRNAGIPDPETDSALLLSSLCGSSPLRLRLDTDSQLDDSVLDSFSSLIRQRLNRIPVQYILHEAPFCGRLFYVDSRVLIPRPETELLCHWALGLPLLPGMKILDLCCGSGCIGLTIAASRPDLSVTLSDISHDALDVAALNAARYNLDVQFYQSDLSSAFSSCSFDLIVCNPPYIPSADCSDLQPEVLKEPLIALDGGKDGMHFYRRIVSESSGILKQGGMLLMELGINEASQVRFALERNGFTDIEIRHDLNGIERMILGTRSVAEGI